MAGLIEAAGDSQSATPLAILPLGTANDLAHACRIPLDPLGALRLAVSGATAAVDVGRVGGRPFMNLATGGFGTQVTVATPNDLKKILGGAAYLLTGVTHFSSIRPARIRLAGPDLNWEGAALVIGVGNGRQAGGGHQLCPTALLNDGLLDVTVLPHVPGEEVLPALRALLARGARCRPPESGYRPSALAADRHRRADANQPGRRADHGHAVSFRASAATAATGTAAGLSASGLSSRATRGVKGSSPTPSESRDLKPRGPACVATNFVAAQKNRPSKCRAVLCFSARST